MESSAVLKRMLDLSLLTRVVIHYFNQYSLTTRAFSACSVGVRVRQSMCRNPLFMGSSIVAVYLLFSGR